MGVLDSLGPVDWSDTALAARVTQDALRALVAHPTELRDLLYAVERSEALLADSECLRLDDKVVLYDALRDRGFRLRLHVSRNLSREVPHDHRFPMSVYILRGVYYHRLYRCDRPLDEAVTLDDLRLVFDREERAGACYTMDHDVVESNMTAPGTMSLLLRGPTAKDRAFGIDRETGRLSWKYGAKDEDPAQRERVRMPIERYRELRDGVARSMGWERTAS